MSTEEIVGGSRFLHLKGVTLGCISPDARELLDRVIEAWEAHLIELKKTNGADYEPGHYGFAYWLIRWSGLVRAADAKPKGKPGFHVISLKRSKKLQRLYEVLLSATEPLSSLELTKRTNLVALSTWASHLRANGVKLANEQRTVNGEQVWYWWIENETATQN